MIHLVIGESGSGKSQLFSDCANLPLQLVDADKRKKDWASLSVMVDDAVASGHPVVLAISRGISTYIKYRPDLQFRLYFIDISLEQIVENRHLRAKGLAKEIDIERIKKRLRRLDSIYRKFGIDGVRGSYETVLSAVKSLALFPQQS